MLERGVGGEEEIRREEYCPLVNGNIFRADHESHVVGPLALEKNGLQLDSRFCTCLRQGTEMQGGTQARRKGEGNGNA